MSSEFLAPNPVAEAVWRACVTELEALKPGNVSLYSGGHGMEADDFVLSAKCVAGVLGKPDLTVGERVLMSVEATRAAVGCNTNLGIVLLCAPLAHAVLEDLDSEPFSFDQNLPDTSFTLRWRLQTVLDNLTVADTERVFNAILLAEPGGLGHSDRHDVGQPASAPLLEVMAEAKHRDRIAYQYVHGYADVFEFGVPTLEEGLAYLPSEAWAAVGVYMGYLARFPDTHIERKLGHKTAEEVRLSAKKLLSLFRASSQPEQVLGQLSAFDVSLKNRGINPGTSADLTVATLFARQLQILMEHEFAARPRRAVNGTRGSASA